MVTCNNWQSPLLFRHFPQRNCRRYLAVAKTSGRNPLPKIAAPNRNVSGTATTMRFTKKQLKPTSHLRQQLMCFRHILHRHFPKSRRPRLIRQLVELQRPLHRHVSREMRKLHVDQFFRVQTSVPVAASRDGLREDHTCSVNRLENTRQVDPSRYLPYQDGREPFRSQLLVDAEEIYLHHLLRSMAQ